MAAAVVLAVGTISDISGASTAPLTVTRFDDPAPNGCNPGDCSLREAIIAANAAADLDTIDLLAGTYTLEQPGFDSDAALGDLDIKEDLTITGQGAAATTIDANGTVTDDRAFELAPEGGDPVVTIANLTMRGGMTGTGRALVSQSASSVTISGVVVTQNTVGSYGAVNNQDTSVMTIVDSAVVDNPTVSSFGGGVANEDDGRLTIRRTTISGNAAGNGGGIFQQHQGILTIEDSTISNNSAEFGGGVMVQNTSSTTITNSTISGNPAEDDGGGLYIQNDVTVVIASSTITQNTADADGGNDGDGGGIFVRPDGGSPNVTITNSIVAENADPTSDPDCDGTIDAAHHTLVGAVSPGCTFPAGAENLTGTAAAPVDPELGPLADNGGPTLTHALLDGSPAIDAANPAISANIDQRGLPRTFPDIGAYELVLCRTVPVNRIGTDGNDVLTGTEGADGFLAQGGNDRVIALGGNDTACLRTGNDRASGGAGRDALLGEAGRDRLNGGGGKDLLICGPGKNETGKGGPGKDRAKKCEKGKP